MVIWTKSNLDYGTTGLNRKVRLVMHSKVRKIGINPIMDSPDNVKTCRDLLIIAPTWLASPAAALPAVDLIEFPAVFIFPLKFLNGKFFADSIVGAEDSSDKSMFPKQYFSWCC